VPPSFAIVVVFLANSFVANFFMAFVAF